MNRRLPFQKSGPIRKGGPDSILAGSWRQIIEDLGVDESFLIDRITRYAERITVNCPEKLSQVRGNLRVDVAKSEMTWYTYTKDLRVIGVKHLAIDFELQHIHRTSYHHFEKILEDQNLDKKSDDEDNKSIEPNDLGVFFKQVLHTLNIGPVLFEDLLNLYLDRYKLRRDSSSRTSVRGYLKKDFYAPRVSWETFMKGMNFLCVRTMILHTTLTFDSGRITKHRYEVAVSDINLFLKELNNKEGL